MKRLIINKTKKLSVNNKDTSPQQKNAPSQQTAMRSFAISSALFAAFAAGIDYTQNGSNWGETYPLCANGAEQSPIDLTVLDATSNPNMALNGYGYANSGDVDLSKLDDSD